MYCTKCGAENREGGSFCSKCGNAIANATAIPAYISPEEAKKITNWVNALYIWQIAIFILLLLPNATVNKISVNALADPIGLFIVPVLILNLYLIYIKKYKVLIFTSILVTVCTALEAYAVYIQGGNQSSFVTIELHWERLIAPILLSALSALFAFKLDNRDKP